MKGKNLRQVSIIFTLGSLLLSGAIKTAIADPSDGACDGLDASSGLFRVCLQAYSSADRVERLTSAGASQTAIDEAQAALDEAIAQYATLGGGTIPGFGAECPCFDAAVLAAIPYDRCEYRGDEDYLELLGGSRSAGTFERATVYLSPEYMACELFTGDTVEDITSDEVDACRATLEAEIFSDARQAECEDGF